MSTVTFVGIVVMHIKGSTHIKQQCKSSVTIKDATVSQHLYIEGVNSDQIQKNQMVIKTHTVKTVVCNSY